jgi:cyclomaltodextrinase / maltogenic alpha-amylase / neopullulanase
MGEWVEGGVFWHVYPLGFVGAEREAIVAGVRQRLGQLEGWLDYVCELGCSGLLLGPVFASETHGYDTVDHLRIDARLGDEGDFERLVAAAHGRGLAVVLDGVFNHVGRSFPRFVDAAQNGGSSRYAHWFRRQGKNQEFATFEGHHALVALDHAQPEVAAYVRDVLTFWLTRGADGFRFDAAYAMPPAFWQHVLPAVRAQFPQAFFFGEVIHGDYAKITAESGFDSITQYELWKAIWSAINDKNFFELAWSLERHRAYAAQFPPMTFIGNHDVTRIASQLREPEHLPHAIVALLTLPGIPTIYAGDEQAFRGVKEQRAGGDDAVRPAFPSSPAELAPFGWPIYRLHQTLIGLRRQHAWLQHAALEVDSRANHVLVYSCRRNTEESLTVVLNIGTEPFTLPGQAQRVLSNHDDQASPHAETLVVSANGWLICQRVPG